MCLQFCLNKKLLTMKHTFLMRFALLLSLFAPLTAGSQNDKALLRELAEENKKSVDALALYPAETRLAILEAARYPEVLIKMNNTRLKTAAAFRTLIEDYPRNEQEVFYNISRYPGMLQQLADNPDLPELQQHILTQMPEKEQAAAFQLVRNETRTVLKINEISRTAQDAFEAMIVAYPAPAKTAFRQLVELPEVLDILNEDLRFTVLVGDVYTAEPAWVIHKMDSLNLAVAREHAGELDEWKKSIENDPQAQQELEAASKEYAADFSYAADDDYDDLYSNGPIPAQYVTPDYAYPWWFGYPWWYPAPCWRPYPWWYDWGFYHRQHFVVVYMPSRHFMHWYFDHPHHHQHYSHLSAHFVGHYYGHRRSGTSISTGVGDWHERNRTLISDDWMKDRGRLPERMKEYGRFEENLQDYNGRNPKTPVTPDVFLEKNGNKYPELKRSRTEATDGIKRERETEAAKPSPWAPRKEPAPANPKTQPGRQDKSEPVQKPQTDRPATVPAKTKETPRPPRTEQPRTEPAKTPPVEKPSDFHRQKWEETRQQETQRARQTAPATTPKQQPQRNEVKPKTGAPPKPGKERGN